MDLPLEFPSNAIKSFSSRYKLNIFKLKPVKTQISWAGWLASTHMKEIDYIVGDHFATPSIDDKNFSEKVYRVGDIWCTYSRSVFDNLRLNKSGLLCKEK